MFAAPLQDREAAAAELQRAVGDLGCVGAPINGYSNIGDENTARYLDEARVEPFWSTVSELDVPIYLHPRIPLPNQARGRHRPHPSSPSTTPTSPWTTSPPGSIGARSARTTGSRSTARRTSSASEGVADAKGSSRAGIVLSSAERAPPAVGIRQAHE
ncbi:MAG TPA: amidohydrolase family protein [Mycobacterium sp.]|nr:amidohydrolase family protein [Mycobacterium sp.]